MAQRLSVLVTLSRVAGALAPTGSLFGNFERYWFGARHTCCILKREFDRALSRLSVFPQYFRGGGRLPVWMLRGFWMFTRKHKIGKEVELLLEQAVKKAEEAEHYANLSRKIVEDSMNKLADAEDRSVKAFRESREWLEAARRLDESQQRQEFRLTGIKFRV